MSTVEAPADAKPIEVNARVVGPSDHHARDAQNTNQIISWLYEMYLRMTKKTELQKLEMKSFENHCNHDIFCRYDRSILKPLWDPSFV